MFARSSLSVKTVHTARAHAPKTFNNITYKLKTSLQITQN